MNKPFFNPMKMEDHATRDFIEDQGATAKLLWGFSLAIFAGFIAALVTVALITY